ncbi:hypothetical protein HG536_0F03970 [Torulaspora globosa]|uniref:Uncharacterized protein n=1 Tax=Torulaspora globosa TaxID=48254 RepID=A0A7G3ZKN6_9SACH|nr:uncharacterized protein HG536_0F03970 [Torulaspora globosa]QLL34072.1 hypothetical protein HG536_0F03970 [Torulaspora globosa]
MRDLCSELKDELLLIAYELAPELAAGGAFGNLRMGQSSDFASNFVSKLLGGDDAALITSRIETVTRVTKSRYKLHYKGEWELEIIISSVKRLSDIRSFLLSKELGLAYNAGSLHSRRKVVLAETVSLDTPAIVQEEEDQLDRSLDQSAVEVDEKPEIKFKYKPVVNLGECIDIYILHRPKRHRHSQRS